MPVQRTLDINLESDEIQAFAVDHSAMVFDSLSTDERIRDIGFGKPVSRLDLPGPEETPDGIDVEFYTHQIVTFEVINRDTNVSIATVEGVRTYRQDAAVKINAYVLIDQSIGADSRNKILNKFNNYKHDVDDLGKLETDLARDGIDIGWYYVNLSIYK